MESITIDYVGGNPVEDLERHLLEPSTPEKRRKKQVNFRPSLSIIFSININRGILFHFRWFSFTSVMLFSSYCRPINSFGCQPEAKVKETSMISNPLQDNRTKQHWKTSPWRIRCQITEGTDFQKRTPGLQLITRFISIITCYYLSTMSRFFYLAGHFQKHQMHLRTAILTCLPRSISHQWTFHLQVLSRRNLIVLTRVLFILCGCVAPCSDKC